MNFKYNTDKPNILWTRPRMDSPFRKGVSWAFSIVKIFYRWKFGNGQNVAFWHDVWMGVFTQDQILGLVCDLPTRYNSRTCLGWFRSKIDF